MNSNKQKRSFFYTVFGAIFLGALGSGLWSIAINPLFKISYNYLLTFFSIGLSTIKNHIYTNIAQGFHELSSIFVLILLCSFIWAMPIAMLLTTYIINLLELKKQKKSKLPKNKDTRRILDKEDLIAFFFLFFISSLILVQGLFINYQNLAITHYNQMMDICCPYLGEVEQKKIRSEFSQIRTKNDYVKIINYLEDVSQKSNQNVPKFDPW